MTTPSTVYRRCRATAIIGACLTAVGVGAAYLDNAIHFHLGVIYYNVFGSTMLLGLLLAFGGFIAWLAHLKSGLRTLMSLIVFAFPCALLLTNRAYGNFNADGPWQFAITLILTVTILAIILLIMAALKPSQR